MITNPFTRETLNANPQGCNQYKSCAEIARKLSRSASEADIDYESGKAPEAKVVEAHRKARKAHEEAKILAEESGLVKERDLHHAEAGRHSKKTFKFKK